MSDEEHFTDVDSRALTITDDTQSPGDKLGHVTTSSSHVTKGAGYHVAHRNPLYCGAEHSSLWELCQVLYRVWVLS